MEPGDGLFFHANVLHRSDQNRSEQRRWTVLHCYNAARNNPYIEHHHPMYTPLHKVDDGAIKRAGVQFAQSQDRVPRALGQPARAEQAHRLNARPACRRPAVPGHGPGYNARLRRGTVASQLDPTFAEPPLPARVTGPCRARRAPYLGPGCLNRIDIPPAMRGFA